MAPTERVTAVPVQDPAEGLTLADAAFQAPIICCDPNDRHVLHAATMEAIVAAWHGSDSVVAACGAGAMKLLPILWPPRVATMPDDSTRCRACHVATGKMRPRSEVAWRAK